MTLPANGGTAKSDYSVNISYTAPDGTLSSSQIEIKAKTNPAQIVHDFTLENSILHLELPFLSAVDALAPEPTFKPLSASQWSSAFKKCSQYAAVSDSFAESYAYIITQPEIFDTMLHLETSYATALADYRSAHLDERNLLKSQHERSFSQYHHTQTDSISKAHQDELQRMDTMFDIQMEEHKRTQQVEYRDFVKMVRLELEETKSKRTSRVEHHMDEKRSSKIERAQEVVDNEFSYTLQNVNLGSQVDEQRVENKVYQLTNERLNLNIRARFLK